jgi:hypothetical protein
MYSRADLRSISPKGGQERRGKRLAGLIRAGAPRTAPGAETGRASQDWGSEIQRRTRVEQGFRLCTSSWLRESSDSL